MSLTFTKEERLCSRKIIDGLRTDGHRLMVYPYSVQWLATDGQSGCQVLIVAPKRRLHHAVDRNRVKRLSRECWRLSKQQLYDFLSVRNLSLSLSLVYVSNEIMPYDKLLPRMQKLVAKLQEEIGD